MTTLHLMRQVKRRDFVMAQEIKELGTDPLVLLGYDEFAYEALPECYKNDHSLKFFIDVNDNICAEHVLGTEGSKASLARTLHSEEYLWTNGEWMRIR